MIFKMVKNCYLLRVIHCNLLRVMNSHYAAPARTSLSGLAVIHCHLIFCILNSNVNEKLILLFNDNK